MRSTFCRILATLSLIGLSQAAQAQDGPLVRDGDTIVFFGDSITQAGDYIDHVEAALLALYPDATFHIYNRGISSETISGTSETDHDPRRPWAHERFTRDVTPLKPDVVIACFGMNDGNYHPFEWPRFEKYQQGVRRLIQRVKEEALARHLILLTPPPFDPYRRKNGDEAAKEFGYKYAAVNYDETLAEYSDWLTSLDEDDVTVIDLHGPLNEHVTERRDQQVSFTLSPDAIHPNMTGHWLMAYHILNGLQLELESDTFTEAETSLADKAWEQTLTLPVTSPLSLDVDRGSLELESAFESELYAHVLSIPEAEENSREIKFRLFADGDLFGEFTHDDLGAGMNLAAIREFPTSRAGEKLLDLVRERRQLEYHQFRAGTDKPLGGNSPAEDIPAKIKELTTQIDALRKPFAVKIRLEPVED